MARRILSFRVSHEEREKLKALGMSSHIRKKLNEWSKTGEKPELIANKGNLETCINCKVSDIDYENYRKSATEFDMTITDFVKSIVL